MFTANQSAKQNQEYTLLSFYLKSCTPLDDNKEYRESIGAVAIQFEKELQAILGFNVDSYGGYHFIRLRFEKERAKEIAEKVKSIIDGNSELSSALKEEVDLSKSAIVKHPNDLFKSFVSSSFQIIPIQIIYGNRKIYDDFETQIQSQKSLQATLSDADYYEQLFFQWPQESQTLSAVTALRDYLGAQLVKVESIEIYENTIWLSLTYDKSKIRFLENYKTSFKDKFFTAINKYNITPLNHTIIDVFTDWAQKDRLILRYNKDAKLFDQFKQWNSDPLKETKLEYEGIKDEKSSSHQSIPVVNQMKSKPTKSPQPGYQVLKLQRGEFNQQIGDQLRNLLAERDETVKLRAYQSSKDKKVYLVVESENGIHRQYFKESERWGLKVLKKLKLTCKTVKVQYDKELFKDIEPTDTLYGDNLVLEEFQELEEDTDEEESISREDLLKKFHRGLQSRAYTSIEDLREEYSDSPLVLDKITRCKASLEDQVFQFIGKAYSKLEFKKPIDSLKEYCEKFKCLKPIRDDFLKQKDLLEPLEAILQVIVIGEPKKVGTIILHGPSNTGKSTLMKIVDEIFICDKKVQALNNFDVIPELKEYAFQVVILEEAAIRSMIKPTNLEDTKLWMERQGKVLEAKGKQPVKYYFGAANLMACNTLPFNQLDPLERGALENRCQIVHMTTTHQNAERFPLSAPQIAHWLLQKYQERQGKNIVEEEEEQDEEEQDEEDQVELEIAKPKFPVLQQAPILGKRLIHKSSIYNSVKQVKRTERDIEWGAQATLKEPETKRQKLEYDISETESVHNDSDSQQEEFKDMSNQQRYDCIKGILSQYYGSVFPQGIIRSIFKDRFREREFSFYVFDNNQTRWSRNQSFIDETQMKDKFKDKRPHSIYTGPVFDKPINQLKGGVSANKPVKSDLVFDVDMDAYDHLRDCCKGKSICNQCWTKFIVPIVKFIHDQLTNQYKYQMILWTFSGGRGVHCRVFDENARTLTSESREAICDELANEFTEDFELKLDRPVTIDIKRVLRLPFSIHGNSLKAVVPFNPLEVQEFNINKVPTLSQLVEKPYLLDKYVELLKNEFFPNAKGKFQFKANNSDFKDADRNPFMDNDERNQWQAHSEYEDIWNQIKDGLKDWQSKLFWFQANTGMLEHKQRLALMNILRDSGVSKEDTHAFFADVTMPEKYRDIENNIKGWIDCVYNHPKRNPSVL